MRKYEPKYQQLLDASDAFNLSHYPSAIEDINKQMQELQRKAEQLTVDVLEIVKKCNEPLYKLWYYVDSDMGNNGGINTIVEEKELIGLFEHYKDGGLYIVDLKDIRAEAMGYTPKFPECVNDIYKKMIMNPYHNTWHNRLLEHLIEKEEKEDDA